MAKAIMKRNYQSEIAAIIKQAQREIMYKAMDAIQKRNNRILKLLEQGRPILEQTKGERFERLYELRRHLWMKMEENSKSTADIWNTIQEFCEKED